ncbi:histidine kinase [Sphingomonas sp. Leaf67]|uniref:response regulator n=1 Tax=unclassified Sphingomonas TaxID=196159 RepID=UPI0006FA6077|nr:MULTISPECIES: response regulator [unclassified Sphingomonas]KQN74558.1 histidine kinase [Sphingomonas sp. Leaf62]KQN89888.1 histidine kinase [Sphingomonas sp. Leaf67]
MTLSTVPYAIVVEDDPIIMMETTYILEDAGFRVRESFDGDEAVVLLDEHWESTVLLFSDVDMPGSINGFALARHVAARWPQIEIVIASGHVSPADGDMPERATFITKPFNQRMVHEHLSKILPDEKKPEPLKKAV